MEEFIKQNEGQVFRFRAYRKTWTPYEVQNAFMDELDTTDYEMCYITDCVNLGSGEYIMELQTGYFDETKDEDDNIHVTFVTAQKVYHRLSDIIIEKFDVDNEVLV